MCYLCAVWYSFDVKVLKPLYRYLCAQTFTQHEGNLRLGIIKALL